MIFPYTFPFTTARGHFLESWSVDVPGISGAAWHPEGQICRHLKEQLNSVTQTVSEDYMVCGRVAVDLIPLLAQTSGSLLQR